MKTKIILWTMVGFIAGLFFGLPQILAEDRSSMTGNWEIKIDRTVWGMSGQQTLLFEIQQQSGKITGKCSGPAGISEVSGDIKGNDFQFTEYQAKQMYVIYKGKVEGSRVTGSCEYDYLNGMAGKGTFVGERK
ncbi:MAG: hypothetical protein AB1585_03770 [Thermodesulfobacteriota bacterium]